MLVTMLRRSAYATQTFGISNSDTTINFELSGVRILFLGWGLERGEEKRDFNYRINHWQLFSLLARRSLTTGLSHLPTPYPLK